MSAPFRAYEPDQPLLFPPNLRDWLEPGHLAYFVMDAVGEMDLREVYDWYEFEEVKNERGEGVGRRAKTNRGRPAYDPRMMTTLLVYAYVTGTPSSRQIEKRCVEDVAFRVISADQKPDHATIAEFRQIHLNALGRLFFQVLRTCRKAGMVKLGHVALDGTKVKANASKHKAMSYGRMGKAEEELKAQIDTILREAQEADEEEDRKYGRGRRGDELPEELARRESRLKKIREAKEALEAEAKEEAEHKREEEEKEEKRREEEGERGKPGKKPDLSGMPREKAQRNFTDPESRIMKNADKAFIQGYNAQAAVDHGHQVIVACDVTNQAPDQPHLRPMVAQIRANVGKNPEELSADAGYFSEENVRALERRGIDPLVAAERLKHGETPPATRGPIPKKASLKERMIRKLRTIAGRARYALRKSTVEPVFGQLRTRGLVRFWLRGLGKVKAEWALWCAGHNLLKLFRYGQAQACRT